MLTVKIILFLIGFIFLSWDNYAQYTGNPILPDFTPDPDILIAGNKYYLYTTAQGINNVDFYAYSSTNLTNWKDEGIVFRLLSTQWATKQGYAPNVVYKNSKYYFYFSGNEQVGVAVGDSPIGPFSELLGKPLIDDNFRGVHIDQGVFTDDDGQAYLYYGQHTLRTVKLNTDMISVTGDMATSTPTGYFEAPFIFKRNGIYYLTWSVNDYRDNDYHIEYATGKSPLGPWDAKGRLTTPTEFCIGPGHNTVLKFPNCDEWYIIYHGHTGEMNRRARIDRLYFNPDGTIQPINITKTGVVPHALTDKKCLDVKAKSNRKFKK
jgi:arabinoxylan arabinofuranohydrolase